MAYGTPLGPLALVAGIILVAQPAHAQEMSIGGCIGSRLSINCVTRWGPATDPYIRLVPQPMEAAERARLRERDRRWAARCHPALRQDRYGVARYVYAMPGCEFGAGEF